MSIYSWYFFQIEGPQALQISLHGGDQNGGYGSAVTQASLRFQEITTPLKPTHKTMLKNNLMSISCQAPWTPEKPLKLKIPFEPWNLIFMKHVIVAGVIGNVNGF